MTERTTASPRDLVLSARARLAAAGIDRSEAALDAELLARAVLGWDRAHWLAHDTDRAPAGFADAFETLVARRERREPVSGIVGHREFWGLDFEVTRDVLAPRPETEIILEEAIACLRGPAGGRALSRAEAPLAIVDVGTGSGCLAVCLAREFPSACVLATDVSAAAIEVAARNARRHGVDDRIGFSRRPLLEGVDGPCALVVSNPPYVRTGDIALLPPEVRDFEPRLALDGGPDGLDVIRALVAAAPPALAPGGWLIVEFGFGQEDGVRRIVAVSALDVVRVRHDLQGVPRTLVARLR